MNLGLENIKRKFRWTFDGKAADANRYFIITQTGGPFRRSRVLLSVSVLHDDCRSVHIRLLAC